MKQKMIKFLLFNLFIFQISLVKADIAPEVYTDIPTYQMEQLRASLNYDKKFVIKSFKATRRKRSWLLAPDLSKRIFYRSYEVIISGKDPVSGEMVDQKMIYHKQEGSTPKPLMVIVPPVLDVTIMGKLVARGFVRREYNVIVMYLNKRVNDYKRPTSEVYKAAVSIVTGLRRIFDFAETQPNIDSTKIGTWGTSLGAVISSFVVGIDDRLTASFIIAGGGNFPEILAKSGQTIVKKYRETRIEKEKFQTAQDFEDKISRIMKVDPLHFAKRRKRDDVFLVLSLNDTTVPTKNQLELWEQFDRPECRTFNKAHGFTILTNNRSYFNEFFNFFDHKLKGGPKKVSMEKGKCLTKKMDHFGKYIELSPYRKNVK